MPLTVTIDPVAPASEALREAVRIVMQGGIVIYPTETIYGIGVRFDDVQALERLFALKQRDSSKPVLLLVPDAGCLQQICSHVPKQAELLIRRFWPGPLTLVLPARADLSPLVTGGGTTVGCRISSYPVAMLLTQCCGVPITSTSANLAGGQNPAAIGDIPVEVTARADVIIDAGPTAGSTPSTVLDISGERFRILRQGVIVEAEIQAALR